MSKYLLLISMLMLSCNNFSANLKPVTHEKKTGEISLSPWIATLTLAKVIVRANQENTLTLLPPFQNHYTMNKSIPTILSGGLFIGKEQKINPIFSMQLGLGIYANSEIKPSGVVWQFDLNEFDNLNYQIHITSQRLLMEIKLLNTSYQRFYPYLTVNLGSSFNKAHDYRETPRIPEAVPTPPFQDNLTTSFSYGVGLGLDYNFSETIRLGLGYQLADFGRLSYAPSSAQLTRESLSLSHLYNHQIRFQVSYLI